MNPHDKSYSRLGLRTPGLSGRGRGFTLIELLTVIAIIGILAVIIMTMLGRVRAAGDGARCKSNLRQIGIALKMHGQDNKGRLPHSLFSFQGPGYNAQPQRLQHRTQLGPYLSLPSSLSWGTSPMPARSDVFTCPAWEKASKPTPLDNPFSVFWINGTGVKIDGSDDRVPPFGAGDGGGLTNTHSIYFNQIANPSREWALVETDGQLSRMMTSSHRQYAPADPVHGNYRNAVFFDGHVGPLKLSPNEPL